MSTKVSLAEEQTRWRRTVTPGERHSSRSMALLLATTEQTDEWNF